MTRVLSRLLLVLSSGQEARGEKCGHLVKWSPYSVRAETKGLLCVWSIFGMASAKPIRFLFSAHTRGLALPGIFQSQSEKSVPRTREFLPRSSLIFGLHSDIFAPYLSWFFIISQFMKLACLR